MGGFHTEYSSLKFALFFLAEYVNMVTVSAMATTLFLGGGMWPWPLSFLNASGWLQFVAFLLKTMIFLFLFIWLRGTLPRLRYDQFMRLGWKVLVPGSLLWILSTAVSRVAGPDERPGRGRSRHRRTTCRSVSGVRSRSASPRGAP